jgi:cyclopropane fatty-acyl-phospholipid synthase-like methyltransferase
MANGSNDICIGASFRRRDKRRQSATTTLPDPFQVVALAVRFDESRQDEALLQSPLEEASLYDNSQFAKALEYLHKHTEPPSPRLSKQESMATLPLFALTPIILSGLLNLQAQQREDGDEDISSELVSASQTMRKAALSRIRLARRRNQIQKIVLPVISVIILLGLYLRTVSEMRKLLNELHYLRCDGDYKIPCRLAEAQLWEAFRNYLTTLTAPCQGSDCDHSFLLLQDSERESPFALHTVLSKTIIPLQELDGATSKRRSSSSVKLAVPRHQPQHPFRWLGESYVNSHVRQAIEKYLPPKREYQMLDIGCGVGGTLYSLLPDPQEQSKRKFSYHGMTVSPAEAYHAHRLVAHHSLDFLDIQFQLASYDAPITHRYTVMVAIESLTNSLNLQHTLINLLSALKSGGVFVLVDDVYASGYGISHSMWLDFFEQAKCSVKFVQDLSMEYEMQFRKTSHWFDPDRSRLANMQEERQEMYERSNCFYYMYVCVKD